MEAMMGRRERLLFAEARFVSARLALQGAGSPSSLWWCAHYDAFERARMALREAVILGKSTA